MSRNPPERACAFCAYEYPEDLGLYGCPNCLGEGLRQLVKDQKKPPARTNKTNKIRQRERSA
jgi:hypothetical protein